MLNTHVVIDYISIMLGDWAWIENTKRINGKRYINKFNIAKQRKNRDV